MNGSEIALSVMIGIALAAACGFRIFVPLLVVSLAGQAGWVTLSPSMAWLGSFPALIVFAVATALEIGGYYIPWVDNLLDSLATPAAAVAGTLAAASFITGMDPMLEWAIAIIGGGGAAMATQASTVVIRAASTATTGGLGNPVVSTGEAGLATSVSILALLSPIIAIILVIGFVALFSFVIYRVFTRRRRRTQKMLKAQQVVNAESTSTVQDPATRPA